MRAGFARLLDQVRQHSDSMMCSAIYLILATVFSTAIMAEPQGGQIVAGSGIISSTNSSVTNITQRSQNLAIDWQSFNLSASETVNFLQPSSSASVLNHIHDQNPSQIFGSINANGQVFLVNPNGIFFAESATVNVGSLIATGLDISVNDFMQGHYPFNAVNGEAGAVINSGLIQAATGGNVALIGGRVVNQGRIVADYGNIQLTTGRQVIVNFDGDGLINIQVTEEVISNTEQAESAIYNTGELLANGGQVILSSHVAQSLFDYAVNNEGLIQARRMVNEGGVVHLLGNSGTVIHSGDIDVQGEGGVGGTAHLLGEQVGLFEHASIDASGATGGGSVLIGGDYQGQGDVQTASRTFISRDAVINASAIDEGNGGKVIIWSDDATQFYGSISAQGGITSGDGGFVETSGKNFLLANGSVDASAANGNGGVWLLDPRNISIINGAQGASDNTYDTGTTSHTFTPDASASSVTDGDIEASLNNGTSVIINTSGAGSELGDITVATDIIKSVGGNATLMLNADNDILVNSNITSTNGELNVTLNAAHDISLIADINSNGGDVSLNAGNNITSSSFGDITTTAQVDSGTASGNVQLDAGGTGTISLSGDIITTGADNSSGAASNGGSVTIATNDGAVAVRTITTRGGSSTGGDGNGGNAGIVTITSADAGANASHDVTLNGDITASGGSGNGAGSAGSAASVTINADAMLTLGNSSGDEILTDGGDVILTANNMAFTGTIDSGSGLVTLTTNDAAQAIQVGSTAVNDASTLGLTDTMLDRITTSGGVTIGNSSHTAGITVVGTASQAGSGITGGTFSLISDGAVNINGALTYSIDTSVQSVSNNISFGGTAGSVTASGNTVTLLAGGAVVGNSNVLNDVIANTLNVSAATGIGAGNAIETNVANLYLSSTSGSIQISETNSVQIDNAITTAGNILITANSTSSDIDINGEIDAGNGTVTITAGNDINFGATGRIQTTSSAADAVHLIANTGAVNGDAASFTNVIATLGELDIDAATGIGSTNAIETEVATLDLISNTGTTQIVEVDDVSASAATGGDINLTSTTGTLTINASGVNAGTANDVTLTADELTIAGSVIGNNVNLYSGSGRAISLGDDGNGEVLADMDLTDTELDLVNATTALNIGNSSAGDITIYEAISPALTSSLVLTTNGAVIDSNAVGNDITVNTLTVNANTGIGSADAIETEVTTASLISNSGAIQIAEASDVSVSASNDGDISITSPGTLTVNASNINADAGSNSTTSTVRLQANEMIIAGTVTGDNVELIPNSGRGIVLGGANVSGDANVEIIESELDRIYATNLTIGDSNSGTISVNSATPGNINRLNLITADEVIDIITWQDITVSILDIQAANGIGSSNSLEFTTDELILSNSGTGDIRLSNNGAVTVTASASAGDISIRSTSDIAVNDVSASGAVTLIANATTGSITDNNGAGNNVSATVFTASAANGIGSGDALETNVTSLDLTNDVAGNIEINEQNAVTVTSISNAGGDINITAAGTLTLDSAIAHSGTGSIRLETTGANADVIINDNITTTDGNITIQSSQRSIILGQDASSDITIQAGTTGNIELHAASGAGINSNGALELNSANDLVITGAMTVNGVTTLNAGSAFIVQRDITTTGANGTLDIDAANLSFSHGVVVTSSAEMRINYINFTEAIGSGNLTLIGEGIELSSNFRIAGDANFSAGNGRLQIDGDLLTTGNHDINITASEFVLNGAIDSTGAVTTISDSGNGMAIGDSGNAGQLHVANGEINAITADAIVFSTTGDIQLSGFAPTSTFPITFDAATITLPGRTSINYAGSLNFANSAIESSSSSINITATDIIMGEDASMTSTSHQIDLTASTGDVLLGLVDAGTADVNITATAGDILNNNGAFVDVTKSRTNVEAGNVTLSAFDRIGTSSTDAVTLDIDPDGWITLSFGADRAYINDLRSTPINNLSDGKVAVGLIFSSAVIGVGHTVGVHATEEATSVEIVDQMLAESEEQFSLFSILGEQYKLSSEEEEEKVISSMVLSVPMMIRTEDGWEFKAPSRKKQLEKLRKNKKNSVRYVDWF